MADYALLVDGDRVARVQSDDALRAWLATYREAHADDDPSAVHVQIIERRRFAWLTGGKLIDRTRFL